MTFQTLPTRAAFDGAGNVRFVTSEEKQHPRRYHHPEPRRTPTPRLLSPVEEALLELDRLDGTLIPDFVGDQLVWRRNPIALA